MVIRYMPILQKQVKLLNYRNHVDVCENVFMFADVWVMQTNTSAN